MVRLNTAGLLPERSGATATAVAEDQAATQEVGSVAIQEVVSPIDGQCVATDDIDGLIDLFEQLDRHDKEVYAAKLRIRQLLQGMSEGDGTSKTRRVRGRRRQAAIVMPDDNWEQSVLREAYFAYPAFRDEFLRIAQIAPKLKEVKKLANMSGTDDLCTFRDMVLRANRGPTGVATIKVEK